jgi:hypothetical protein
MLQHGGAGSQPARAQGYSTTLQNCKDHFWWPTIDADDCWFVSSCFVYQTQEISKIHTPLTVPEIPTLFCKVHMDYMKMPASNKFTQLVQACCTLSSWREWRPLHKEDQRMQTVDNLAAKYGIRHIKILPYSKEATGWVEQKHFDIQESIMKACNHVDSKWSYGASSVIWAEQVTICCLLGYSPLFMAHRLKPTHASC